MPLFAGKKVIEYWKEEGFLGDYDMKEKKYKVTKKGKKAGMTWDYI